MDTEQDLSKDRCQSSLRTKIGIIHLSPIKQKERMKEIKERKNRKQKRKRINKGGRAVEQGKRRRREKKTSIPSQ